MARQPMDRLWMWVVACVLFGAFGCNTGRYPVAGKVTYDDGTPLTEGNVVGEAKIDGKAVGVQGNVGTDGSFAWGTEKSGDGAAPGKYRVSVLPRALGDVEISQGMLPAVDSKFTSFASSGLEFEVKNGRNELNIKVTRPNPKKR